MKTKTIHEYEFTEQEIIKALKLPKNLKLKMVWTSIHFGSPDTVKIEMEEK